MPDVETRGLERPRAGNRRYRLADVTTTYKRRDAWWTVFLVDPLASRLVLPIANRTSITPNQVSTASLAVGVLAAAAFAQGHHGALLVGAMLYHLSFVLDCVDGKLARLKGTGSVFGMWLDYSFDRYRVLVCAVALMYGQFQRTGDVGYVWLAVLVTFLDMLRYMDALQVARLRREMNRRLRLARRRAETGTSYLVADPGTVRYVPGGRAHEAGYYHVPTGPGAEEVRYELGDPREVDLHREFRVRFRWWARVRDGLMRHRVRPHLFSGIEYQMFIFVLGPALDAVVAMVFLSAALLLVFEVAIIYKLLLSSRDFEREIRRLASPADAAAEVTATATAASVPDATR